PLDPLVLRSIQVIQSPLIVGARPCAGHPREAASRMRESIARSGGAVEEAFVPVLAPGWLDHFIFNEYYKTEDEFLFALADALREEYRAVVAAGFVLQIDDPGLPDWWDMLKPEPPAGKMLMPGVVSHATNLVEHPQLVADRILRYVAIVGRENVIAGTDCGLGGRVTPPACRPCAGRRKTWLRISRGSSAPRKKTVRQLSNGQCSNSDRGHCLTSGLRRVR